MIEKLFNKYKDAATGLLGKDEFAAFDSACGRVFKESAPFRTTVWESLGITSTKGVGLKAFANVWNEIHDYDLYRDFETTFGAAPEPQAHAEWWWTVQAIRHAAIKLSEPPPRWLYHGLNGVGLLNPRKYYAEWGPGPGFLSDGYVCGYANLISTSMSEDMATTFAKGQGGTVDTAQALGSVLCFDSRREDQANGHHELATCDLRWISKFPDEQEWLLIPTHQALTAFFQCEGGGWRAACPKDGGHSGKRMLTRSKHYKNADGSDGKVNYYNMHWASGDY